MEVKLDNKQLLKYSAQWHLKRSDEDAHKRNAGKIHRQFFLCHPPSIKKKLYNAMNDITQSAANP